MRGAGWDESCNREAAYGSSAPAAAAADTGHDADQDQDSRDDDDCNADAADRVARDLCTWQDCAVRPVVELQTIKPHVRPVLRARCSLSYLQ